MKPTRLIPVLVAGLVPPAMAQTNINTTHKYSYGANVGWMNWRGDGTNGGVISTFICYGAIYAANVGWINLGNGSPANGIQYQNNITTDFGVNLTPSGKLRGLAYGANIGWINFEDSGDPHINLLTGKFGGHVYSANCGWISLDAVFAHVETDSILPGVDSDGDGMPDAWELANLGGTIAGGPGVDTDGDGQTDLEEYLAGTDPNDPSSLLAITSHTSTGGTSTELTWRSVMNRNYFIEQSQDLNIWFDSGIGVIPPSGPATSGAFVHPYSPKRFFRVRAVNPLAP